MNRNDTAAVRRVRVSAPGSLMLLGEHAVLHGARALACAVNRRMVVTLTRSAAVEQDPRLTLISELGRYEAPLRELPDHPGFRFVLEAVRRQAGPQSLRLEIESDFSSTLGFGSSAAVTAAVHAALAPRPEPLDRGSLFAAGLQTVRRVQGCGSGADLAAAVYGGAVCYRMTPCQIETRPVVLPLAAVYCGYKRKTAEVIAIVEAARTQAPETFRKFFEQMDRDAEAAFRALTVDDRPTLGRLLNENQQRMEKLGLNTPELDEIVCALQQASMVYGAKISGSGLGDCAVGLGSFDPPSGFPYTVYPLETDPDGVRIEEVS